MKINCLTDYGKGFLISFLISLNHMEEENAEETLDIVGSVPINNGPNQESNSHELDRVTRNTRWLCNECHNEERENDCLCCHDVTAISESQSKVSLIRNPEIKGEESKNSLVRVLKSSCSKRYHQNP